MLVDARGAAWLRALAAGTPPEALHREARDPAERAAIARFAAALARRTEPESVPSAALLPPLVLRPRARAVAVRLDDPVLHADLARLAAKAHATGSRPVATITCRRIASGHAIRVDRGPVAIAASRADARWLVVRRLVQASRPAKAAGSVLHGAAAALGARAVALVGESGAGKTTLLWHLLDRGLAFLADDVVAVDDAQGRTGPVALASRPKPLIRARFAELFSRLAEPPGDPGSPYRWPTALHRAPLRAKPRLEALVFPRYAAGANLALERLQPLEVLLRLCRAGAMPDSDPTGLRGFLAWLGRVPAWSVTYAEADRAAAVIAASLVPGGPTGGAGGASRPARPAASRASTADPARPAGTRRPARSAPRQ